ncbi:unnamed protein product [Cyprideis torosa]|uniref:Uncharacterized protein n=1 Tax=Cyprideis torosa TaxID=163714 RepID=A0A7R8ZG60_9CRUS|nr:unnamed protein product [Cyprideis torosa]CAG0880860.1 unnamed protein product [Cyprideis torosa]
MIHSVPHLSLAAMERAGALMSQYSPPEDDRHRQHLMAGGSQFTTSRTMHYKKVMKPLLERKRRARINRCLDELKNLMVDALGDPDGVQKMEKADILELTVKHLRKIRTNVVSNRRQPPLTPDEEVRRFQAGFTRCAEEVGVFFQRLGPNSELGSRLMSHLGQRRSQMNSPKETPISVICPQWKKPVPGVGALPLSPPSSPEGTPSPASLLIPVGYASPSPSTTSTLSPAAQHTDE